MVGKQHSSDYILSAINHYKQTGNYTKTCSVFGCKRQTLKRWHNKYSKRIPITRKTRKEGAYKVNNELVRFANNRIKEQPDIFIKDLLDEIKKKFPDISVSRQHLGEIIRDNNRTRKRLRHIHEPLTYRGKERDHKKEISDYLTKMKTYYINKIIALDETGIYASLHGTYGRCVLGKRCAYKTTDNKVFKKYSLLIAIKTKGVVGWKLYEEGAVNSDRLTEFIRDNITEKFEDNIVIMDNAGFHKTQDVKQEIQKKNNFIYTVPYYPRSNPIENFFSQLKYNIKKDAPTFYADIKKVVEKSIGKIQEKNYRNYFLYAFDKDSVKKIYTHNSTLKRKPKIYKD